MYNEHTSISSWIPIHQGTPKISQKVLNLPHGSRIASYRIATIPSTNAGRGKKKHTMVIVTVAQAQPTLAKKNSSRIPASDPPSTSQPVHESNIPSKVPNLRMILTNHSLRRRTTRRRRRSIAHIRIRHGVLLPFLLSFLNSQHRTQEKKLLEARHKEDDADFNSKDLRKKDVKQLGKQRSM